MTDTPADVIEEAPKQRRQSCTDHCGSCGGHFHGLGAFDAHRQNGECVDPAEAANRDGKLLLQVWTEAGSCELSRGAWKDGKRVRWSEPVVVWQKAQTEEQRARMQAAFEVVAS